MQEQNQLLGYIHASSCNVNPYIIAENVLVMNPFYRRVLHAFLRHSLPSVILEPSRAAAIKL